MDFKQLQSFVAVVRHESFTKAAVSLGLSQPTISMHVRTLEEELGTPLVLRTAGRARPTAQGAKVFDQATRILVMRDRIVDSSKAREGNTVYIGSSSIPSAYILPDLLANYVPLNPDARFLIFQHDSQDVATGLVEGVFDCAFTGMPVEEDVVECIPLCRDEMVLVTSNDQRFQNYVGAGADGVAAILSGERLILRQEGSGGRATTDAVLEAAGLNERDLSIMARVNDQETIKNLVQAGLGVTIVSRRAVADRVRRGELLEFGLGNPKDERFLYLSFRRGGALDDVTHDFVTFVRQTFAGQLA